MLQVMKLSLNEVEIKTNLGDLKIGSQMSYTNIGPPINAIDENN